MKNEVQDISVDEVVCKLEVNTDDVQPSNKNKYNVDSTRDAIKEGTRESNIDATMYVNSRTNHGSIDDNNISFDKSIKDEDQGESSNEDKISRFDCPSFAPGWLREVHVGRKVFYYPPEGERVDNKSDLQKSLGTYKDLTNFDYMSGKWISEVINIKTEVPEDVKVKEEENTMVIGIDPSAIALNCYQNHDHNVSNCLESFVKTEIKQEIPSDIQSTADLKSSTISTNICKFCGYSTKRKSKLKLHIGRMHSGKPKKNRTSLPDDKAGVILSSGPPVHFCKKCDFKHEKMNTVKQHIEHKHEGKTYFCDICGNEFTLKRSLQIHIQNVHRNGGSASVYLCGQCGNEFKLKRSLKIHIQNVHEGVKYDCDQCPSQFTQKKHVRRHKLAVHEGVKYNCDQCQYQATQPSNLRAHKLRTHDGVKYNCDICSYQVTRKELLQKHKLQHLEPV